MTCSSIHNPCWCYLTRGKRRITVCKFSPQNPNHIRSFPVARKHQAASSRAMVPLLHRLYTLVHRPGSVEVKYHADPIDEVMNCLFYISLSLLILKLAAKFLYFPLSHSVRNLKSFIPSAMMLAALNFVSSYSS